MDGSDNVIALAVSPSGARAFVTGSSDGSGTFNDYATVAYDAVTGQQQWAARFNGPVNGSDRAVALGVSPAGTQVFVTGVSPGSVTDRDYATVAYNAATGQELWVARFNGPANRRDEARALGVSPDGSRVFVTGTSRGSSTFNDYATVAYDAATGQEQWVALMDQASMRPKTLE